MKFSMLPERLRRWILLSMLLAAALSACTPSIVMNRPASSCLTLVPEALRADTPGAPLPAGQEVGPWVAFGVAQTGQLSKSNVDKRSVVEILTACEKRDAEAVKAITRKPFLKRIF